MAHEKVEANENIRATQIALGLSDERRLPFLCECDDVACRALVRLTSAEYAEARTSVHARVVAEGHEAPGRVILRGRGYLVLEP